MDFRWNLRVTRTTCVCLEDVFRLQDLVNTALNLPASWCTSRSYSRKTTYRADGHCNCFVSEGSWGSTQTPRFLCLKHSIHEGDAAVINWFNTKLDYGDKCKKSCIRDSQKTFRLRPQGGWSRSWAHPLMKKKINAVRSVILCELYSHCFVGLCNTCFIQAVSGFLGCD